MALSNLYLRRSFGSCFRAKKQNLSIQYWWMFFLE